MSQFFRFELRTTDAEGGRAFYRTVLGHDRSIVWPLHEEALARGARPHWLGSIGVEDIERSVSAFVERGATPLGPVRPTDDGRRIAVLRDPGGALMAIATPLPGNSEPRLDAVWHVLNTRDAARATVNYQEVFGWQPTDRVDLGAVGAFQNFAWSAGGANAGAIADVADRFPRVHPHWLFFFEVPSLDASITATRAAGGVTLDSLELPDGDRICVCDDPQGAAFGVWERK